MPTYDKKPPAAPANPEVEQLAKLRARTDEMLDQLTPKRLDDAVFFPAVQRLIAAMPARDAFVARDPAIGPWIGEASALLQRWDSVRAVRFRQAVNNIGTALDFGEREYSNALAALHEARYDVELRAEVPTAAFVDKGKLHDYFKQVADLVAQAKVDLLISDRYLNADFVARYIPFVTKGARVRLLVRRPEATLLPALDPAAAQYELQIGVHAHDEVHDRYLFIDGAACYHSGASFADGGKTGPTMVAPIVAFAELQAKYEAMWAGGAVLR